VGGPTDGPLFRDVDADDVARLVAMMAATDRWPAVRSARAAILDQAAPGAGALVVDVGSGPGTFTAAARTRGATTVDLDRSTAMLATGIARDPRAAAVQADVVALPIRTGTADLVHAERVLQWCASPADALAELHRITRRGGHLAITDTDWSTLALAVDDPGAAARLSAAALLWVPHPTLAASLPDRLRDLGAAPVTERADVIEVGGWDPDDPDQHEGPPGLPLRTIVRAVPVDQRRRITADVDSVVAAARAGRFSARLTLVTAVARC
jgi:SAM-dependent methyltransferase